MKAIADILREAADKIEAVCDADKVSSAPIAETPSAPALPDPPEGFHPAMIGPIKGCYRLKMSRDIIGFENGIWNISEWTGDAHGQIYALRIGSEIARLNGLESTAIPADKEPEPAKQRREWELNVQAASLTIRARGPMIASNESVAVREVLPGDPSPEQVAAMIDALECAKAEKMGWLDAVEQALQPFTGKDKP